MSNPKIQMSDVSMTDTLVETSREIDNVIQIEDPLPPGAENATQLSEVDQRDPPRELRGETAVGIIEIPLIEGNMERMVRIGAGLSTDIQKDLIMFLRKNQDVFAQKGIRPTCRKSLSSRILSPSR